MRKLIMTGAVMASLVLVGCESGTTDTYTNSSGSLALSRDDGLLYAADSDNDLLAVVDTKTHEKIAEVKVGKSPERVIVAPDDTIYVTNRFDRSVSVIRRGEWTEASKVKVGVEPTGLAVSPDNKTLYVVNSTSLDSAEVGSLQAIDTATLQTTWELKLGEEPRAIALLPGDKALISLYKQGEVVQVDLSKPEILKGAAAVKEESDLYGAVNKSYLQNGSGLSGSPSRGSFSSFKSRAATDVVASPDGKRVFMPVVWAREDRITTAPNSFGGYYANGGPCNLGAIATAGVVTLESDTAKPLVDDLTSCSFSTNSDTKDFPPSTLAGRGSTEVIQGPTVAAVDPTGAWLFVVNRETKNVAILPTSRRDGEDLSFNTSGSTVRALVNVGDGANGIALSRDGKSAYVYNAFDHTISVLTADGTGPTSRVSRTLNITVAQNPVTMTKDVIEGRKLFFDAHNARMSNPTTGVACATCHLEGREDGHVWMFPDGPRQTPSLAGRMVLQTAPYHWSGEFNTLQDFMTHTTTLRMGGVGITETMSNQVASYIDWAPVPENPYRTATLSDAAQRGAQVFVRAECNNCHAGEALTNNKMANVGTYVVSGINPDDQNKLKSGLNTPSLLTLSRTAPYLHDGSAGTLKERLMANKNTDLHGKTSVLTDRDMDDLVEYLKTL